MAGLNPPSMKALRARVSASSLAGAVQGGMAEQVSQCAGESASWRARAPRQLASGFA
jgi:hypothetical protein